MRCLHCGKDVPLLKRLAGNEFCSEAHRREYQQEYSKLALGRLLQSKPSGPESKPTQPERLAPAPTLTPGKQEQPALAAVNIAAPAERKPTPVVAGAETTFKQTVPPARNPEPTRGIPLPAPTPPAKKISPEPAFAQLARIQKPVPAVLQMAVMARAEFERAFPAPTPDRPRRQVSVSPAVLEQATPIRLERVQIANAPVHPVEPALELRESARGTPRIDLELGIAAPDSLGNQCQPLIIPFVIPMMSSQAPPEAALWMASHRDFTEAAISLGDFANFQFSPAGFEATPTPRPGTAAIPDLVVRPIAVALQPIAPGETKPAPVFGAAHFSAAIVQVPQPSGLPLRPLMVLSKAGSAATPENPTTIRSLPPAPVIASAPAEKIPAEVSAEPDLGLPELRLQAPPKPGALLRRQIAAATAGVVALVAGIVIFASNQNGSDSKPAAKPAAVSEQWIPNFATDTRLQRKVSVLQSSLGLRDYRLEFDGSIQIKGLGWVYRAQDPKNFYVSTIELQKPGQDPVFVIAHYAVINEVAQPRSEVPLRVAVPLGTDYKIRFEAVGDRFSTWVQDQKADEWTDARLKTGGAGLYREGAEQFTLHGDFRVTPLPTGK